ncbi:type 1 glutamine amidotransferase domain-containing protein [Novosphingobium sp. 9U]|uniref:type 1 glutamine amidotransferase domain-containing protein n=1 Tax=Novosphingobium sp. 9U TaxID=2653158 RepID=UPI0012F2623C|nr:type 1 glutamine amidotransferase domain-containing protein [Novosphingobium sp. 9U]VWX51282.1 Putative cysteine protease YraA [Novosphingobium sp. 9U]
MAKKVLILATDGFEQVELTDPKKALEDAGIETTVASPKETTKPGEIKGWKFTDWGDSVKVDQTLDEVNAADFDALLLPGGQINPDKLRLEEKAVSLVKQFVESGKPVAAICHGPWLLVEADVVKGKTVTSWPSIRTDLRNAGANVVDQEVAVDGQFITSRKPDDIPAFSKAVIEAVDATVPA